MDTKKTILLIIGIIIGIIILVNVYSILTAPSAEITDITVEKCGKVYRINYTFSGDGSTIGIAMYKNNQLTFRTDGSTHQGANSIIVECEKDITIDKLRFTVYDDSVNVISTKEYPDFEFKEVNSIPGYTDVEDDINEDVSDDADSEMDSYDIAASHRDNYDYDHDGFLNDYEFRQWAIGEGQEELLNY